MSSEFDFIKCIREQASKRASSDLVLGIGDDAAVLGEREGRETLVTVDLLVEEIDFKLDYAVPRWLGHKVLAVSLSDIAAMGGEPKYSLLTLGIPSSLIPDSHDFWKEFFDGYFALAEKHNVVLIGGDISRTPDWLTVDSIVIGHCRAGKAVRRSGARVRDAIYLTGTLGASAAGLSLLLSGARVSENENIKDKVFDSGVRSEGRTGCQPVLPSERTPLENQVLVQSALHAHLRPEPQVGFGRLIGESGLATSMIDVSDGLAQDLKHICEESRVAAIVDYDAVPIADEVHLVAPSGEQAFRMAVSGGEDFELLFTADRAVDRELFALAGACEVRLTRIGEIVSPAAAVAIVGFRRGIEVQPMVAHGYNHFRV